jgi:hypothetical protein
MEECDFRLKANRKNRGWGVNCELVFVLEIWVEDSEE